MAMEEKMALAELRRDINKASPETQERIQNAYDEIKAVTETFGNAGKVVLQILILEYADEQT